MLPAPRIIAIDDKRAELEALTEALSKTGAACLGILFDAEQGAVDCCPDARVVFFDLHLLGDAVGTPEKHFSTIVNCLEQMKPEGPYAIIVWSQHPDEVDAEAPGAALYNYLCERLDPILPRPYVVMPLPKAEHLSRSEDRYVVENPGALRAKVDELLAGHPQVGALLFWEKYVLSAAASTVSQLIELSEGRAEQVKGVMASLAIAAVGQRNVDQDRFYALNEVLVPILSDRMSSFANSANDSAIWENAFCAKDREVIAADKIGNINKFINVSTAVDRIRASDRGAVIRFDSIYKDDPKKFIEDHFGASFGEVLTRCFGLKSLKALGAERWVVLQAQAACDYAQKKPQVLSYFLGLEIHRSAIRDSKVDDVPLPDSLWVSPVFSFDEDRVLLFNAGSMLVLPLSVLADVQPVYRLREQILNDLLFKLRIHQARPGIISLYS